MNFQVAWSIAVTVGLICYWGFQIPILICIIIGGGLLIGLISGERDLVEKNDLAEIKKIEVGGIYEGLVTKITDFGAFVTIKPGCAGLVHISELAKERVRKVTDVISEGETIRVKVLEISRDGKIRLSRKALLEAEKDIEKQI